jgi:hypothetical protein
VCVPSKPLQPSLMFVGKTSSLYYKHIMIVNDAFSVINKFESSLTQDARVIIYNHHMVIVEATGACPKVGHLKGTSLG